MDAARELLAELVLEQKKQLASGTLPHSDPHKLKELSEILADLIKTFKPSELVPPTILSAFAPKLPSNSIDT
jgi:hypothetical protein